MTYGRLGLLLLGQALPPFGFGINMIRFIDMIGLFPFGSPREEKVGLGGLENRLQKITRRVPSSG